MNNHTITKDGKLASIITHLAFFIGIIIAWFINNDVKDPFAKFYIRQTTGISFLFFVISAILPIIPEIIFLPTVIGFYIFIFILWIYSFTGAISNEYKSVPIIGNLIQNFFNKLS
nr:hypothetical protein [uncultured Flavobacterium sp.]